MRDSLPTTGGAEACISKLGGIVAAVALILLGSPGSTAPPSITDLGQLPTWNLNDLYTSPASDALLADIVEAKRSSEAFGADYRGKVAQILKQPDAGAKLARAIQRYDHLVDSLGRVFSYAKLLYSSNMSDSRNTKLYQDIQTVLDGRGLHLLFSVGAKPRRRHCSEAGDAAKGDG